MWQAMIMNKIIFIIILLFSTSTIAHDKNEIQVQASNQNLPSVIPAIKKDKPKLKKEEEKKDDGRDKILRFSSIKSNEANARIGPGLNYPILWVFVAKNEPLAIIKEFNEWREIMDVSGGKGWIHSSILSPKRYVIISGKKLQKLHVFNTEKSRILALVEPDVRCLLKSIGRELCRVTCDEHTGWIKKNQLWGLMEDE